MAQLTPQLTPKLPTHPEFTVVDVLAASDFGWEYLVKDAAGLWVLEELLPSPQTQPDVAALQAQLQVLIKRTNQLEHPQLMRTVAPLTIGERLFLLREYVPEIAYRQLLCQAIEQGELFSEDEVWDFLIDVLQPLALLHDRGIVHGALDLNAVLSREEDGTVLLQRFGGLREFGRSHHFYPLQSLLSPSWDSDLRGMPQDLHDLAWIALVLLTGEEEFTSMTAILNQLQQEDIIGLALGNILAQMLMPQPWQQFCNAREVLEALNAISDEPEAPLGPETLLKPETLPEPIPTTPSSFPKPTLQSIQPPPVPGPPPRASTIAPPDAVDPSLPKPLQPRSLSRDPITTALSIAFIGLVSLSLWRIASTVKIPFLSPTPNNPTEKTSGASAPTESAASPVGKFSGKPTNAPSSSSTSTIDQSTSPQKATAQPATKPTAKPTAQPPAKPANTTQEQQGIPDDLYNQLVAELPKNTSNPQARINDVLGNLSEEARREMGRYYRKNYDRWFATLASRKISQPTVDILADTSLFMRFPSLQDQSLNPRTFGQVWYALARDHITALNQQKNLKVLKAGNYNETGKLHNGQGRVFQINVQPGQRFKLFLKTSKQDVRLSVIENEIVLARYSTNTQWTAPVSKRGATYEVILTPMRTATVNYKISFTGG